MVDGSSPTSVKTFFFGTLAIPFIPLYATPICSIVNLVAVLFFDM